MPTGLSETEKTKDRIEKDTIILHDRNRVGPKTLKRVEIITEDGSKKSYKIRRTIKGGYLFNN